MPFIGFDSLFISNFALFIARRVKLREDLLTPLEEAAPEELPAVQNIRNWAGVELVMLGGGLMIWKVKAHDWLRPLKSKLKARLLEVSCLNIQHLKRWSCHFWHFRQKVFASILLDCNQEFKQHHYTNICTFRSGTKSLMMWWLCLLFRMASLAQAWGGCWKGKQIRQPEEGSSLMRWAWAKPCRPSRCFWQAAQLFGGDVWARDGDQRPKSLWILLFFLFCVAGLSSVC